MSSTTQNNITESKIKPYMAGELATLYGVSKKTLNTWLLPHREFIGEKKSLYYTAKQVSIIFERLGEP